MVDVNRGPRSDEPTGRRPAAVRRTLEQDSAATTARSAGVAGPWVSGVLGAVQALAFSLAVVIIPAIAMVVAANAQLSSSTSGWTAAVPVASRLWLLGHGVPLVTGSATLTLVPLGITAVAVFAVFVSARRTILSTPAAFWSAAGAYTVGTLLVAVSTGSTSGAQLGSAALGGFVVALVGLSWGLLTGPEAGLLVGRAAAMTARLPRLGRSGVRGAATAAAMLALLSGLLTLLWVLMGWSTVGDVLSDLRLDAASTVSLGIAQLALVPNLAVYAGTWLAGPGFAVGAGTHFGADLVTSGPLPAIPLLGALPAPTAGGGVGLWAPVLVGLAGAVGGWVASRRTDRMAWWHTLVLGGLVGVGAGVATAVMVALASGVAGPGRLADVGASSIYLGACVAVQAGAGALLVLLATRAEVHEAVASAWRSARARRRTDGEDDAADGAAGGPAGVKGDVPSDADADADARSAEARDAAGRSAGAQGAQSPAPDPARGAGAPGTPAPAGGAAAPAGAGRSAGAGDSTGAGGPAGGQSVSDDV